MSTDGLIFWFGVTLGVGYFFGYMHCLSHDRKGLPKLGEDKK